MWDAQLVRNVLSKIHAFSEVDMPKCISGLSMKKASYKKYMTKTNKVTCLSNENSVGSVFPLYSLGS